MDAYKDCPRVVPACTELDLGLTAVVVGISFSLSYLYDNQKDRFFYFLLTIILQGVDRKFKTSCPDMLFRNSWENK